MAQKKLRRMISQFDGYLSSIGKNLNLLYIEEGNFELRKRVVANLHQRHDEGKDIEPVIVVLTQSGEQSCELLYWTYYDVEFRIDPDGKIRGRGNHHNLAACVNLLGKF